MTQTIEQKAPALIDEVQKEYPNCDPYTVALLALDRAIEQHEATKQELQDFNAIPSQPTQSDALRVTDEMVEAGVRTMTNDKEISLRDHFAGQALTGLLATGENYKDEVSGDGWVWFATASYHMAEAMLAARKEFILPKPDPLVEVLKESDEEFAPEWDYAPQAKAIRAALEARGLEIREKNDDQ